MSSSASYPSNSRLPAITYVPNRAKLRLGFTASCISPPWCCWTDMATRSNASFGWFQPRNSAAQLKPWPRCRSASFRHQHLATDTTCKLVKLFPECGPPPSFPRFSPAPSRYGQTYSGSDTITGQGARLVDRPLWESAERLQVGLSPCHTDIHSADLSLAPFLPDVQRPKEVSSAKIYSALVTAADVATLAAFAV